MDVLRVEDVQVIAYDNFNRNARVLLWEYWIWTRISTKCYYVCFVCSTDCIHGLRYIVRLVMGRKCTPEVIRGDTGDKQSHQSENLCGDMREAQTHVLRSFRHICLRKLCYFNGHSCFSPSWLRALTWSRWGLALKVPDCHWHKILRRKCPTVTDIKYCAESARLSLT